MARRLRTDDAIASMHWERRARHIVEAIRTPAGVERVARELDEMDADGEHEGSLAALDVLAVVRQHGDDASAAGFDELFALQNRRPQGAPLC